LVQGKRAAVARVVAALVAVQLIALDGRAQTTASGFAVGRFNPSERGSDWFVSDSLDLRGPARPAVGLVSDYAYRPLVFYNADGSSVAILRDQLIVHAGVSLVAGDRLRLAVNLPISAWQDGQDVSAGGVTYSASSSHASIGDLRLAADLRLYGEYGGPFTIAIGCQVFLQTGDRAAYLSDGTVRLLPRLELAGDVGPVAYALGGGFLYHDVANSFAGYPRGQEVVGSAALGVRAFDRKLLVGPEVFASTVVTNSDALWGLRQTPVEALFGVHLLGTDWRGGVGAGPGLTRGFGEPEVRVVASLEYFSAYVKPPVAAPAVAQTAPPSDRDKDGIPDPEDACPDEPGVKTDDPKTNGCPPDRDKDGVPDDEDACPDVPGVETNDPKTNGCPPDRDKDGIPDAEDACPDQPGVKTDDPKTNGCPPDPDRDKDGIPNDTDACPDQAGPPDPDPKKNGCPKAFIQGDQIKILDQVKFATGSAAIVPGKESMAILDAVLTIMVNHPEITSLRVEGHTDSQGTSALNQKLSQQRAASVVRWLVQHGITASRLTSQGFGFDRPIDTNETPEGRKNNRRVEFHIEGQK
jgi:outer membrane protein OmpA-like peptidoglycan-associated protein